MSEPADLERPDRWRPSRAGVRNIWEYDDQVFEFADGRLILRGPNGSGKSNALALLVPFLLDGIMAASRMDSLGGGRSMRTLLLCLAEEERGRRFRHDQRTGYVWLELERAGAHRTVGCGARASSQRDAEAWFFVTDRRCGIDLDLAPGGVPLSRGALIDELGSAAVNDAAEAHRAAVDRALFGLGDHRYRNLVELLLVLRRPHLAGKLNVELLSKVLSDGLVALDDRLVADVAASFEDLEAVQRDLRRLRESHAVVLDFLPTYRRYLRAEARRRAGEALAARRSLRAARRRTTDATRSLDEATAAVDRFRRDQLATGDLREAAEQRRLAVLQSPAYQDATAVVDVEARVNDATAAERSATGRRQAAEEAQATAVGERRAAESALAQTEHLVDAAYTATADSADRAGVAWSLGREAVEDDTLAAVLRGLASRRRSDLTDVRGALLRADQAEQTAREAARSADRAADDARRADEERDAAVHLLDTRRGELAERVEAWRTGTSTRGIGTGIDIGELDPVVEAVTSLGEADAPGLAEVLAAVLQPRRTDLAERRARATDGIAAGQQARLELVEQRRQVAEEPTPSPEPLTTRPADRRGRPGAPLFACCDFAPGVPHGDRAGLEAALEAAGVLDAWIAPDEAGDQHEDGLSGADLDAWLHPLEGRPGPTLADVLIPTPPEGSGLDDITVAAVLRSIALEDAAVAMLPDGRYRLGPLQGRYAKVEPEFIGATARELRRVRRLADLDARIAAEEAHLEQLEAEQVAVETESAHLDGLARTLPSATELLAARQALLEAAAAARTRTTAAGEQAARAERARQAAAERYATLVAMAGERRLPADEAGLDEVDRSLTTHQERAGDLVRTIADLRHARTAHRGAAQRSEQATQAATDRRLEHEELRRSALALQARLDQLLKQLGGDAQAPLRELQDVQSELDRHDAELKRLRGEADEAHGLAGAARQELAVAEAAVAPAEAAVRNSDGTLDVLRRRDVWPIVGAGGAAEAPPEPGALATAVMAATEGAAEDPDDNALDRAYRKLLDELRSGYDPSQSHVDRVPIVEVTSEAGTYPIVWLADELGAQVDRQQKLLSERDRAIFEHHLLTRVAEELRTLLADADDLVGRINRSLADRPTSSGKTVALRWELDTDDPRLRTTIGLLRKSATLLGPDEREQLRTFFSSAIAARRADQADAGYAEILRDVLDYRSWHAFVPHVRSAGGGTQRLTRTVFRSLSGGEQAVVLHLPLFAAAAAHYDGARPGAPRLVALDEAFAGIDEGMRAELMGLLVRFDLDMVLTGHELWGAYEQVPSLMAYDLLRHPPLEGVSAFAVRWDGRTVTVV